MDIIIRTSLDDHEAILDAIAFTVKTIREDGLPKPHFRLKGRDGWLFEYTMTDHLKGNAVGSGKIYAARTKHGISLSGTYEELP